MMQTGGGSIGPFAANLLATESALAQLTPEPGAASAPVRAQNVVKLGFRVNGVAQSLELDVTILEGLFLLVLTAFFSLIPAAPGYVGTFDALVQRAHAPEVSEIILALNATVDGQTTAHYITDLLQEADVKVTRLAHGVPVGGELDYLDEGTLSAAMRQRTLF